jgi:NADP-dependent 3-hydroxy acid dehydrogenase YdfG
MAQVISQRLRSEGAEVLISGRNEDELRRFAAEIGAEVQLCDITDRSQVFALANAAKSRYGGADIDASVEKATGKPRPRSWAD